MEVVRHSKECRAKGQAIKHRVTALVNALDTSAKDLEADSSATESPLEKAAMNARNAKRTCTAIEKLYGFLDLLDRKASSLITLNGFLLAFAGIFVFTPLGVFKPITEAELAASTPFKLLSFQALTLISGGLAAACSLIAILLAVYIFRIRWTYMAHVVVTRELIETSQLISFSRELSKLCNEAAFRNHLLGWIRGLTYAALGSTAISVLFQIARRLWETGK